MPIGDKEKKIKCDGQKCSIDGVAEEEAPVERNEIYSKWQYSPTIVLPTGQTDLNLIKSGKPIKTKKIKIKKGVEGAKGLKSKFCNLL